MRHLTIGIVLPFVILSALPAQAQSEMITITPEQIGQVFCIGSLGNDMSPVNGVLSEDLTSLIHNAFVRNNEYLLDHPGDMPPMGNGVPWRSWQDYADGCTVGDASVGDLIATVVINYTFSD